MLNNSDEGILNGFGWIDGSVRSLKSEFSKGKSNIRSNWVGDLLLKKRYLN